VSNAAVSRIDAISLHFPGAAQVRIARSSPELAKRARRAATRRAAAPEPQSPTRAAVDAVSGARNRCIRRWGGYPPDEYSWPVRESGAGPDRSNTGLMALVPPPPCSACTGSRQ
jgi:hypothetical protein